MSDEFRVLAEERARRLSNKGTPIKVKSPSHRQSLVIQARNEIHLQRDYYENKNSTTIDAAIAAVDYRINGYRARADTGEFIRPRWEPDNEIIQCNACSIQFDWVIRRHHCRNCGRIYCHDCSTFKLLLPQEFGERDPQRVCKLCANGLLIKQASLSINIANHMRTNSINLGTGSFNIRRYLNLPFSKTLGSEIRKATYSTYNLFSVSHIRDEQIPIKLLTAAKGIAFITVLKGGLFLAPSIGTGLLICRLPSGQWSAPTSIGLVGINYGFLIGADLTDYVILLNSQDAIEAFSNNLGITAGIEIEIAAGPVGRSGQYSLNIGDCSCAPAIAYSHSRGLFAGVALSGLMIFSRPDVNHRFYGKLLEPPDILSGRIDSPKAAQCLYEALRTVIEYDESKNVKIIKYD